MSGQTIRLHSQHQRRLASALVMCAPDDAVLNIRQATRTSEQNDKLWSILSDVARAKPQGRTMTTDNWKCLFLASLGHKMRFEPALDGDGVVALGYRSSRLNKAEMSDLIEAIYAYGSQHGVVWSEPQLKDAA